MAFTAQNFVNQQLPAVGATWLNGVDVTVNSVLAGAQTVAQAQAALGILPLVNPRTAAEIAAGITPVNYQYPVGNVKRYGAAGDGVTDDTVAIQTAINVFNPWNTFVNIGNYNQTTPDYSRAGTVFLPAGQYLINSPLLLAPNITLQGATFNGGAAGTTTTGNTLDQLMTTIIAGAGFLSGNYYMVDTGNWRQAVEGTSTPVTPYRAVNATDMFYVSQDKDNFVGSACPGIGIFDIQFNGNGFAFGGVRIQVAFYFRIDRIKILSTLYVGLTTSSCFEFTVGSMDIGAPICWFAVGCESMTQHEGEVTAYAVTSPAWITANQALINTVFYTTSVTTINPTAWYNLALKPALFQWCINFTMTSFAGNAGTVGIELYRTNLNMLHWENEYTTTGVLFLLRQGATCVCDGLSTKSVIPLATGDINTRLIIRQPFLIQSTMSFTPLNSETTSGMLVELWNLAIPDQILGISTRISNVNLSRIYNPLINDVNSSALTLYCSTAGSATLDGLSISNPTTIDGALTFMSNNPHIVYWTLALKDGQTHQIAFAHQLNNVNLTISRDYTGTAGSLSIVSSPTLNNCQLAIEGISVNAWTPNNAFTIVGLLIVNLGSNAGAGSPSISIPAGKVLFSPSPTNSDSCRIMALGSYVFLTFGTGAGLCGGGSDGFVNYEDAFVHPTIVGTAALEAVTSGRVKCLGSNVVGTTAGFGTPTGGVVISNFPGASATLAQTSETVAELIAALKSYGILGA